MVLKITHEQVFEEYVINGLSDYEIANKYGVCRTSVTHIRNYHNIDTRLTTNHEGREHVKKLLQSKWKFSDMRSNNKTFRFDILISRVVRVQIYSAKAVGKQRRFGFTFSPRESSDLSDEYKEKYFIEIDGKWFKDLSKSCDVVFFCGIYGDKKKIYIIPSHLIPITQNFNIPFEDEKWKKFINRWSVVESIIKRKMGDMYESAANL